MNTLRSIRTASALVIGDEILGGKTLDRNSHYFARFCFRHGIALKRVEVVPDTQDDIIEASRRMVARYDLVVTSGGIGPTHDDITYPALAKAFRQHLRYHPETLARMDAHAPSVPQSDAQRLARRRMALLPHAAEVLFVSPDTWVPVVRLEGKLCVLPGIPSLFQSMLDNLAPFLVLPPAHARPCRRQVFTTLPESSIAPYLAALQTRVDVEGIRIGSYPRVQHGVYVSLVGTDHDRVDTLAREVAGEVQGRIVSEEEAEAKRRSGNSCTLD